MRVLLVEKIIPPGIMALSIFFHFRFRYLTLFAALNRETEFLIRVRQIIRRIVPVSSISCLTRWKKLGFGALLLAVKTTVRSELGEWERGKSTLPYTCFP